jgi:hypothetical protein
MEKQYQCNVDSTDKLTIEISQYTRRNVIIGIGEKTTISYIALSPKDALDLAKSITKELKGKSGQSKADLRAEILELKQLNAALASTQLDAVNRLECEVEELKMIGDTIQKFMIGDTIQKFMIGGYEFDKCVIEFDSELYAYVGVHKATGSQGLLYKHLDSLKYQKK